MSSQCAVCHKKSMRGNLVSHSKQRTHRLYRVNLHTVKSFLGGIKQTLRVCTKCLRRLKKEVKIVTSIKPVAPVTQTVPAIVSVQSRPAIAPETQVKPKEVKVKTTTIAELMKETAKNAEKVEEPKSKS